MANIRVTRMRISCVSCAGLPYLPQNIRILSASCVSLAQNLSDTSVAHPPKGCLPQKIRRICVFHAYCIRMSCVSTVFFWLFCADFQQFLRLKLIFFTDASADIRTCPSDQSITVHKDTDVKHFISFLCVCVCRCV